MRPTLIGSYDPPDVIKSIWVINYWVIDVDTPIMGTTSAIAKVADTATAQSKAEPPTDSPTNKSESEAVIEAADKYLSTTTAMVIMNPVEKVSLMRFTAVVNIQENISSKADTLIDTAASLNFVSKRFLNTNGFYKYCKAAPKIAARVANEHRISTDKIFCPTVFTID